MNTPSPSSALATGSWVSLNPTLRLETESSIGEIDFRSDYSVVVRTGRRGKEVKEGRGRDGRKGGREYGRAR